MASLRAASRQVMEPDVVVVGQLARDLVLVVGGAPGPGGSAAVRRRRELLGGKGANQILRQGPSLVAPAVGDAGNCFAWPGGELSRQLALLPER